MKILENYIAPTEHSQGDVGDIWIDKSTGDVYKCTGITGSAKDLGYITIGADATNSNYMWEKLGGGVKATTFYLEEVDAYYLYHDMEMTRKVSKEECESAARLGLIFIIAAYAGDPTRIGRTLSTTAVLSPNDEKDYAELIALDNFNDDYVGEIRCHTSEYVEVGPA